MCGEKEKIYVLVLITAMDRAGAETVVMNYLQHLDRNKIQMDFLVNRKERADYEEEIESLGSKVYHMTPMYPGKFSRYKREFKRFLVEHPEYQMIHSHLEERSYFALKIAKKMGIPVRIAHAHSVPKGKGLKQVVRLYFRKRLKGLYTHAFACGEGPARWLFGNEEVVFIKNAVDTERFLYSEGVRREMRKQLKVKDDTLVIGHVGRTVPEKNQEMLIDIFYNVNKQRPESKLLLIGGGNPKGEQKYKKAIVKKVKDLGLETKVKWLGVRDDVHRLMQAMDVLVMPSTSEGFPVTLVEAQAAGLRCVVSDAIDYSVNLTEEMQYESLDSEIEDWANKIISFSHEELDKSAMNEKVVQAGFDIKEQAKKLEAFYEGVM